ncbi:MAG: sialidase family protein [bacterium]|nr:sialidase family protein [bacterium]
MNISFLHKPLGCLLFVLLLFVLANTIVSCAVDVVQVNIVKRFSPDYKTWAETAKGKKEERQKIAEEETKRIADEIAREKEESLRWREMSALVDIKKIEIILKKEGYNFNIPPYSSGFYVLDNFVWVCGDLWFNDSKGNYFYPAIAVSEDRGNNFKLSKIFCEFENSCSSHIFFLEKNVGYLSIYNGYFITYKTSDGGNTWNEILSTKNANRLYGMGISYVKRIRITNDNIYLITSLRKEGFPESVESNDNGKLWTYKRENREVAKTSNKGETWEIVKKGE